MMTEMEPLNNGGRQPTPDFGLRFLHFNGRHNSPGPTKIDDLLKLPDTLEQEIAELCETHLQKSPEQLEEAAAAQENWLRDFLRDATPEQLGAVLLYAAHSGHSDWTDEVSDLVRSPAPQPLADGELNALHVAVLRGHSLCVEKLLEAAGKNLRRWLQATFKGFTPLQLAIYSRNLASANAVFFAMSAEFKEKSEEFGTTELVAELNRRGGRSPGYTALHVAALKDVPEMVQCLMEAGANAELVLANTHHTPLHLAALCRSSATARALIGRGASLRALTNQGLTALAMVSSKTPKALEAVPPMLDACLELTEDDKGKVLKVDFTRLQESPTDFSKNLLYCFVSANQRGFLQHPVCQILLDENWDRVRSWFYARLFVCFVATLCVTSYMVAFQACGCSKPQPRYNYSSIRCNETTMLSVVAGNADLQKFFMVVYNAIVPLTVLEIVRKLAGFFSFAKSPTTPTLLRTFIRYIKQFENYFEWFCLVTTLHLFYGNWSAGTDNSNWAALVILLSWANLMTLQGQIPIFGVYVEMYVSVLKEFLKLLTAYILLLIGYGISFYIIFRTTEPFSTPIKAIWKTFAMMTGELEYNDLFESGNGFAQTDFLSTLAVQIIFVAFLFTIAIVLMNLLVGVVVHDVNEIKSSALLTKLERKVELVVYLETTSENIKLVIRKAWQSIKFVFKVILCRRHSGPFYPKEVLPYVMEYAQSKDRDFDSAAKNDAMKIAQLNKETRSLDAGEDGPDGPAGVDKESHLERRLQRNQWKIKQIMIELNALVKENEEISAQKSK